TRTATGCSSRKISEARFARTLRPRAAGAVRFRARGRASDRGRPPRERRGSKIDPRRGSGGHPGDAPALEPLAEAGPALGEGNRAMRLHHLFRCRPRGTLATQRVIFGTLQKVIRQVTITMRA